MTEFTGEIHPYAAIFPMLPDEDLKALAEDIAANGQLHPILLTPDGVLVDGRNRLAACDLAGIEPRFQTTDADPVALIMSANLQRRDLPARMKAYYAVSGFLDSKDRPPTQDAIAAVAGCSSAYIAQAQVVARFAPESFRSVIAGIDTADAAYQKAKAEKDRLAGQEKQATELREKAPDLLGLDLPEAWAAYLARTKEERDRAEALAEAIRKANVSVTESTFRLHLLALNPGNVNDWLTTYDPGDAIHPVTHEVIDNALTTLAAIKKGMRK